MLHTIITAVATSDYEGRRRHPINHRDHGRPLSLGAEAFGAEATDPVQSLRVGDAPHKAPPQTPNALLVAARTEQEKPAMERGGSDGSAASTHTHTGTVTVTCTCM